MDGPLLQVIILGAPGSGKGTQARWLAEKFGLKHISTGDLLRAEIKKGTELGDRIGKIIDRGNLVDDELVKQIIATNVDPSKWSYVFDGHPRTYGQAITLHTEVLARSKVVVLSLVIDPEILVSRIVARKICSKCGTIFKSVSDNIRNCNRCGELLIKREDDNRETVLRRIEIFNKCTGPVIEYFRNCGVMFKEINASGTEEQIRESVCTSLGLSS